MNEREDWVSWGSSRSLLGSTLSSHNIINCNLEAEEEDDYSHTMLMMIHLRL